MPADHVQRYVSTLRDRPDLALAAAWLYGSWTDGRRGRWAGRRVLGLVLDPAVHPTRESRLGACRTLAADLRETPSGRRRGTGVPDGAGLELVVLNDLAPLVARRIVNEGRPLLSPRPEVERAFLRDVQLRAADMVAFLKQSRRMPRSAVAT